MPLVEVTDPSDDRLRDYFQLTDVALRSRREPEMGLYLAESREVIGRAIDAGHRPRSFLMDAKWLPVMDDLLNATGAGTHGYIPVYLGREPLLRQITGFHLHRGAIASMHRPTLPALAEVLDPAGSEQVSRRVVILEDIVDHTNVGAIIRSVAALGADAVLVTPRCADPLYRRSVRVSMGTVFQVPWTRLPAWPADLEVIKAHGFTIAGLDLRASAVSLDDFCQRPPDRLALVFGTEGTGLSAQVRTALDVSLRIPMHAGVDSLNVAAAAAVALWSLRTS